MVIAYIVKLGLLRHSTDTYSWVPRQIWQQVSGTEPSSTASLSRLMLVAQKYFPLDELPSPTRIRDLNIAGNPTLHYGWEINTKQLVEYLISIQEWPTDFEVPKVAPQPGCVSEESTNYKYHEKYCNLAAIYFQIAVAEKYKIDITWEHAVCMDVHGTMFALWSNHNMTRKKGALANHRLDTGELALEALTKELRRAFTRAGEAELMPKWYWSNYNKFE